LFVFEDKQVVTYLGVDPNFSQVNDIKKTLYNGQWIEPDTYQVVVDMELHRNSQWDC
jgi:lipoprotein-releasing system permease protein